MPTKEGRGILIYIWPMDAPSQEGLETLTKTYARTIY
ncbi:hypothetical protein FOXB_00691 [Fusarium oxysporum f. sp. conglutinans Fo5176]|uniref:Uncharacterized protein n=1 Tax=Fusarium oxysporum (strain Fo5176) TaxID=660025 RepID=F9F2R6_FUSOF|nr:hypothetical protein FOXB_00691 [Fusarium oxysporum f. sp. conglutinans Fo5176]